MKATPNTPRPLDTPPVIYGRIVDDLTNILTTVQMQVDTETYKHIQAKVHKISIDVMDFGNQKKRQ